jgi:hypothetical protein
LTKWRKRYNVPSNKYLKDRTIYYIEQKDWYRQSYKAIKNKYGQNTDLFIKLLAATSPRNTVKRNLFLANKTLTYILDNKPIDFSYGIANKAILNNVNRIIANKPINGPKVRAFSLALSGDADQVVIDSWMLKAFNIKRQAPTPNDRVHIKTIINKLSDQTNLKPCEIQACLWSYAKNELNNSPFKEDNDFSYYMK